MKFRARMVDLTLMRQFSNIVYTLSKISRSCVMRICPDKLYLIILDDSVESRGPMAWCTIEQNHFFNYYKMEGTSESENEIFLEFEADMLSKSFNAVKSSSFVKSIKLKLTNKISPCLTFEIELPSGSHSRRCVHDIPVDVITRRNWAIYSEPKLPTFDVSIQMPSMKLVKSIAERMRTFSQVMDITVSNDGTLVMRVENNTVNIATTFKDLFVEHWSSDTDENASASAQINIKTLLLFLTSDQMNPSKIVCNVLHNRMVHMFLTHDDLSMHYFLTTMSTQ